MNEEVVMSVPLLAVMVLFVACLGYAVICVIVVVRRRTSERLRQEETSGMPYDRPRIPLPPVRSGTAVSAGRYPGTASRRRRERETTAEVSEPSVRIEYLDPGVFIGHHVSVDPDPGSHGHGGDFGGGGASSSWDASDSGSAYGGCDSGGSDAGGDGGSCGD